MKFLANCNTIVSGMSGCGKTQFILKVIRTKAIQPFPKNIYYMYKVRQDFMKDFKNISFIEGLDLDKINTSQPSMVIIDDLMLENSKELSEMFILGSHHKKISLFYLTQNIFQNSDLYRLMSANAHYMVIFSNRRNFRQVNTLAHQIFVGKDVNRILEAYKRESLQAHGFIVLCFSPKLPPELTVVTDWWSQCPSVYL